MVSALADDLEPREPVVPSAEQVEFAPRVRPSQRRWEPTGEEPSAPGGGYLGVADVQVDHAAVGAVLQADPRAPVPPECGLEPSEVVADDTPVVAAERPL